MPRLGSSRPGLPNRRPRRLLLGVLIAAISIFVSSAAVATELRGLDGDALVIRDSNGIPHVCTASDHDTFFMQGYLHAQDRFFQMDTLRRTFSGTLAELLGAGALPSDVQFRTFGLRRAGETSLAGYQAAGLTDSLDRFQAYADGVNAYLASNPLPPEYAAVEITQAAPWTIVDTLTIGKGLAFGLSFDLLELDLTLLAGAYSQVGAIGGFDGMSLLFDDIMRQAPFDPTISIPQSASVAKSAAERPFAAPDARTLKLAQDTRDRLAEVPRLKSALERRIGDTGSNWWLIDGERSASGHAMLANDPHLGLDTPSTFYEMHLIVSQQERCGFAAEGASLYLGGDRAVKNTSADLDANGVSFPGAPGLVQGCNQQMCWGSTVNPMDVTDVYQEVLVIDPATGLPTHTIFDGEQEPLLPIPQAYGVNQIGDGEADTIVDSGLGPLDGGLTLVVPRRLQGPILSLDVTQQPPIAFSVQYTGWGATLEFEAFFQFLRADSVESFRQALQFFDVGSQNWAYADIAGNIAYFTSAELPLREDLQDLGFPDGGIPPFLIRDGTGSLQHEWKALTAQQPNQAMPFDILPFAEMPQEVNPARGYIINANNDPIGNTLDNNTLNEVRPGGGVFYLSPGYASLRQGRIDRLIVDLLADGGKADADELMEVQANNQLLEAELISPFLVNAFTNATRDGAPAELQALAADAGIAEAISRLGGWDFSTPTGLDEGFDPGDNPNNLTPATAAEIDASVAATIWSTFRGQVVQRVIDGTLTGIGLGDFLPDNRSAYVALANLLMNFDATGGVGASGVPFFQTGLGLSPADERDVILLQSLGAALDLLASDTFAAAFANSTDQSTYRWGKLHRIVFNHPLGGPFDVPNAGGVSDVSPELRGVARAGGYEAVDASRHSSRADGVDEFMFGAGPARRFVGVLDPAGIQGFQIIPGGQSGVLTSPDYASQLRRWLVNDYHPLLLTPQAVVADRRDEETFQSPCAAGGTALCFQNQRFQATVTWSTPDGAGGQGRAVAGSSDLSGNFYFASPDNWEMLVKVLDGCAINGRHWVFAAAASDLGWVLTVEDTQTGEVYTATNPFGSSTPVLTDTDAFSTCP
ncbi:MAG: penicillin acylase family protein [Acidobacteriota bacterium]